MAKGRLRSPGIDVASARDSVAAVSSIGTFLHEVREQAARTAMSVVRLAPVSGNRVLQCGERYPDRFTVRSSILS